MHASTTDFDCNNCIPRTRVLVKLRILYFTDSVINSVPSFFLKYPSRKTAVANH
jgi:hypothetical protein